MNTTFDHLLSLVILSLVKECCRCVVREEMVKICLCVHVCVAPPMIVGAW